MGFNKSVRPHLRAVAICLLASIGAIQFGYDGSYFSGILVLPDFQHLYGSYDDKTHSYVVASSVMSLVTSIINVGEFIGALTAFWVGDKAGRKGGLYISSLCVVVGTILQVSSSTESLLITGRLVLGYAVGLISCFVPLYIADCSPAHLRGVLTNCYQLAIAIGLILGVVVDYTTKDRKDSGSFRIPMSIQFIFPLLLCSGLILFAPESPRWLMYKGRPAKAEMALRKLHGKRGESSEKEDLALIEQSMHEELQSHAGSSWKDLVTLGPEIRKAYLGFSLQAWQQASGINFVTGYGVVFFSSVGISNPLLISLGLYLVCIPAIWLSSFLIEQYGRRPVLILSGLLMAATSFSMGAMGVGAVTDMAEKRAIVAMVFLFMIFFNVGWGPTVWTVCAELATGRNRGKLMSVSTASNWFWNWLVSFTFPYLFNPRSGDLGAKIGFIYGALMTTACLWIFFFLPETAQRSLEQIDEMLEKGVPARKFKSYVCVRDVGAVGYKAGEKTLTQSMEVEV